MNKFDSLLEIFKECYQTSLEHGFWGENKEYPQRNYGEAIALITSELSESLEAYRHKDVYNMNEELADTLIRLGDLVYGINYRNLNKDENNFLKILEDKMAYNTTRPYKHNKEI